MDQETLPIATLGVLAAYVAAVLLFTAALIGISHLLGERRTGRAGVESYESGIAPTGPAWMHFDVKYYLLAMFFVIFDLESIFIFAWAVSVREAGWRGYLAIAIFIGVMMVSLLYLWKMGALDWGTAKKQIPGERQ